MKALIFILLLFSIGAQGQNVEFKLSKFAKIKVIQGPGTPPPADTQNPSTPTLSFVDKTTTTISVSWTTSTDNVAVTGYDIYVNTVYYATEIGTSIVISGLTPNTEYDIYIKAKDAAGNSSANSNTITQSTEAQGITFYVSNTGSDAAAGTTPATAWQTISKVNSTSFSPGNQIFFKRGDMWREQLTIPSSGTADSLITFSAYGTGAKPIINGADIETGWTSAGSNQWYINNPNATTTRAMVIIDNVIYSEVASLAAVNSANEYFIDVSASPDRIYVYSTDDPDLHTVEVSNREYCIVTAAGASSKKYIEIADIEVRYAGRAGIYFEGPGSGVGDALNGGSYVRRCKAYANRLFGIVNYDHYDSLTVEDSRAEYNGNGFYSWQADEGSFRRDTSSNQILYVVGASTSDGHAFGGYQADNWLVENCNSDQDHDAIRFDAGGVSADAIIRYNKVFNSRTGTPPTPGMGVGSIGAGALVQIYYNLIVNCAGAGFTLYSAAVGTVQFYNNTIFLADGYGTEEGTMYLLFGTNFVLKNNIFARMGADGKTLLTVGTNLPTSDYNQWYQGPLSPYRWHYNGSNYSTLALWRTGSSQDANSQSGDPLFVNVASDWSVQSGSPVINAGVSVGLTQDILGNSIIGLPDIGCYEILQSNPTTPVLSFVAKTATTVSLSWTTSTDDVGVTGYNVYKDGVFYANEIGTSIVVTGLTQNTEYDFYVRAEDADENESPNSNTITQTTNDAQAPTAPTLAFVSKTTTSISVSWSGATDNVAVTSYDVYKDGVFYSNGTGTTKTIIGLTPSTEYDINVKAKDAAGNQSVNSNTITQTTDAEDPPASGNEFFRIVTTNPSGWEWREGPSDVTWEAMQLYNGTGTGNITASGGTYRGYVFTNSSGHCLTTSNASNLTIEYCIFKTSNNVGFRPVGGSNITVQYCLFTDVVMGMYIFNQTGNLKIKNNYGLNFQWDRTAPMAGTSRNGQFIHTGNVTGTGNEILDNRIENVFGRSYNEDCINLYDGHGTSASHFKVRRNLIRGGGTSGTGGGILMGDACGTYNDVDSNRLIHPGWYGVQIFGGNTNRATYNYVFSEPQMPWNSVGYLIYDGGCTCTNMTMNTTNVSRYRRSAALYGGNIYNFEDGGGCSGGPFNVTASTTLTEANMPMPDGSTGFPSRLIDCVSEDDYWKLVNSDWRAQAIINSFGVTGPLNNAPDVNPRRPTASVSGGPTINITTTSTTLTNNSSIASGGAGTFTLTAHSWTHVSGPNTPTIVSPTGTSTSITGLAHGTHVVRYVVEQNNSVYNLKTYKAYWVTINVDLT